MTLKRDIGLLVIKCGQVAQGHGKCFICGTGSAKRGMTIHHCWYLSNNDVTHDMFPKNDSGRLEYYKALFPKIVANPKRFMYLCNTHHFALEKFNRYGNNIFDKLCLARKMTKT